MANRKKSVAILVSLLGTLGGIAGFWGAYTAHDASKFQQPIDLRAAIVDSFRQQIESAEKRNDSGEVLRVRLAYESYEEGWRNSKKLAALVKSISSLAANDVSDSVKMEIKSTLNSFHKSDEKWSLEADLLASAYFAIGDYRKAINHYTIATNEDPGNTKISALLAAAQGRLSAIVTDTTERTALEVNARRTWGKAVISDEEGAQLLEGQKVSISRQDLQTFFDGEAELQKIMEERPA